MTLKERIAAELPELISIRHDLHRNPELGYQERRTSEVVSRELEKFGVAHRNGMAGGTGVRGHLPGTGAKDRTIALRADMDALPILEETGLPYASECPGKMHACGHDGHTTILLGAARVLSKLQERPNDVVFVFQPAEEGGAGAERMCQDGVLDGVDMIFGLHGWPVGRLGVRQTRIGPMMASADVFNVVVHGKGGHAAFPHFTVDPIVAASHIVVALQSVVSRNIDPLDSAVVTVAKIEAGSASNIIPEACRLTGTLRTLNDGARAFCRERIQAIVLQVAASFGASAEIEFVDPYPVTVNDAQAVAYLRQAVPAVESGEIAPVMGAEDFSYYGKHGVPACFFTLGLLPEGKDAYPGLHTPLFDFNDDALAYGIESFCQLALLGG